MSMPKSLAGKYLLTEAEAAELIGFSKRFLQARRLTGNGPKWVSVSRRAVRYRFEDLQVWAEQLLRSSTSS